MATEDGAIAKRLASSVRWRRFLLCLCAFGLIQLAIVVWMSLSTNGAAAGNEREFTSPFTVQGAATQTPFIDRITVATDSSSYRAGLRTGDLADLRPLSAAQRYRWFSGWQPRGQRIDLPVVRGGEVHRVSLLAEYVPLDWDVWLAFLGLAWMLAFATLIAWRRADSAEARLLVLVLVLSSIGNGFYPINWDTGSALIDAITSVFGAALYFGGFALFATYAMTFTSPHSLLRRFLAWLSYASATVVALYAISYVLGIWTLTADPTNAWYSGTLPQIVTGVLPLLFPVLCVAVTIAQTRGVQRARLAWSSVPLALYFVALSALDAVVTVDLGFKYRLLLYATNIAIFIAPIGLTYALLSRRVLDITFALNRALVFSGVSVVVVGIFVLVEWVLTEWLGSASRTANLAISAAIALVLGLSVRAIHHYVDRALDSIFFRKRHEDEKAIRTFAHEAAYITDPGTLVARAKEALEVHAGAAFVNFALDDGAGCYSSLSENDPAIVALKTWRKTLDLHTLRTDLRGEFAYPMIARGRMIGVLVVGPKRSGESYAPDESDAIAQLAHAVGGGLDILTMKAGISLETLSEQLRDLRDTIVAELRATRARPNAARGFVKEPDDISPGS